jgi:alpha-glucoside transport system permease protein
MAAQAQPVMGARSPGSARRIKRRNSLLVNGTLALICLVWTIPTVGLLVSSFRTRDDIATSGWWSVLPHREWQTVEQLTLSKEANLAEPVQVAGASVTDLQLREGVTLPDGRQARWANRRQRLVALQEQAWTTNANFSLSNYQNVLTGKQYTYQTAEGNTATEQGNGMGPAFLGTLTIAIPSTIIPILLAAFAAYGFAWMRFPGRRLLFAAVVAMLVVPLQVALIPVLSDYVKLNLNGTPLAVWLAHTGFGLPLATYLLYNYISQLPREVLESAFIDGATPFTIFTRLILPLSVPALASFAIFQFLWVWNDFLVALIFLGNQSSTQVLTMRLADVVGSRGQDWHLLTAGAFVSMIVPLLVFFGLQRYFVSGLLAGSVKG